MFAEDAASLEPYVAYPQGVPLDQWAELNHSRRWSVFYLWRDGKPVADHLRRCPRTAQLLAQLPLLDIAGYAPTVFFSILDAKSHIPAHTGVTNTRVIVHLPLIVPPACRFRVGSTTREWRPGEAWVFDDTIEHEAWNDSDVPRAILIFDVWNPYLTAAERDLVSHHGAWESRSTTATHRRSTRITDRPRIATHLARRRALLARPSHTQPRMRCRRRCVPARV